MKHPPLATSAELVGQYWILKAGNQIVSRHPFWAYESAEQAVKAMNSATPSTRRLLYQAALDFEALNMRVFQEHQFRGGKFITFMSRLRECHLHLWCRYIELDPTKTEYLVESVSGARKVFTLEGTKPSGKAMDFLTKEDK
jgi:hypothetical protein